MNSIYKTTLVHKVMLAVLLSGVTIACSSENNAVEQTAKAESKKAGNNKVLTYVGKPSAPITLDYVLSKENLEPGEEFSIQLSAQSPTESPIVLEASSFKNFTLLNSRKTWQINLNKSGHRDTLPALNFIAAKNGTFYLKLMASIEQDGKVLSKPFVIPVVVGDGTIQLQSVGEIVTDSKGQKIIIQKADSSN